MSQTVTAWQEGHGYCVKSIKLPGLPLEQDIYIENGTITRIVNCGESASRDHSAAENQIEIHAKGCMALPGLVDLYSRCREPGLTRKGNIESESQAALAAGFTQVLCTPDTNPTVDNVATVELISHRSSATVGGASIIPMAALTLGLKGEQLSELATLKAAGCPVASQADQPLSSTTVLYSAMQYASSFDMPLLMNARDSQLGVDGCAHTGAIATSLGLPTVPVAAETVALLRLIELCRETGCALHISRVSSARAVQYIADAKQSGLPITCDVGLHHLFYIDEMLAGYDASFHSAVPFRSRDDRDALREGLANGIIDAICSDHAPHDVDAGLAPFPATEPGLSAYDWFIPLLLQVPSATGMTFDEVIATVHDAPLRILGKTPEQTFREGNRADFIVLDTQATIDQDKHALRSAGTNNPLSRHTAQELELGALRGKVQAVFHNGATSIY